jgi:hypothetical protein
MSESVDWQLILENWCIEFDVPQTYLPNILANPKVTPMIRGYAFEYNVMTALRNLLPAEIWKVEKLVMNAQDGLHDNDVLVHHKTSGINIRIECKLAKKGSFRIRKDNPECQVKCMRSRTLGEGKLPGRAQELGVSVDHLRSHSDNYTPGEFDYVVSGLSNAFYSTDEDSLEYIWAPSNDAESFLRSYGSNPHLTTKEIASGYFLLAKSEDLTPFGSGVKCSRRSCSMKDTCKFIPNYPVVSFSKHDYKPIDPWFEFEKIEQNFLNFVTQKVI